MSDLATSRGKNPPLARTGRTQAQAGGGQIAPAETPNDEFLAHYFRRIEPRVADSFTSEQREAIHTMFGGRWAARHAIDLRGSFPLGRRRYYLVFLFGRDRRRSLRLRPDHREELLGYVLLAVVVLIPLFAVIFGFRP